MQKHKAQRDNKVLSMIELFNKPANTTNERSKDVGIMQTKTEPKPIPPPKPLTKSSPVRIKKQNLPAIMKPQTTIPDLKMRSVTTSKVKYWKTKEIVQPPSSNQNTTSKTVKNRINNFEQLSKKISKSNEALNGKSEKHFAVNPIPKPRRLFANNNLKGNKFDKNRNQIGTFSNHSYLAHIYAFDRSATRSSEAIYSHAEDTAEVTPPITPSKWKRHHEYEDVDELSSTYGEFTKSIKTDSTAEGQNGAMGNYDRLTWNNQPRSRSHSLTDDGYAKLTFERPKELCRAESNFCLYSSVNDETTVNGDKESNSNQSTTLVGRQDSSNITEIIRDMFSPKSSLNSPTKSVGNISSGSNDDSDNEFEVIKHKQTLDRVRTMQKNYRQTLKYKTLEGDLSGANYSHAKLFDRVIIATISQDKVPKVSYSFPDLPNGKKKLDENTIALFCFPDVQDIQTYIRMPSQNYSFMLTDEAGSRQFGYCLRILPPSHVARYPVVYCIISSLGSFALFHTILIELEQRHRTSIEVAKYFLKALYKQSFPAPGTSVHVKFKDSRDKLNMVLLRRPLDVRLEHVDLQCLINQMGVENTIKVFVSLLLERRIILCGKSLNSLTACVHALRAILYPFVWQHVFIPVLPLKMLDLCCVPTPLLIGILHSSLDQLKTLPLEEVIIVDLHSKEIVQESKDELDMLPKKLQNSLMKLLETRKVTFNGLNVVPKFDYATDIRSAQQNNFIAESFLHLFVEIFWQYSDHCKPVPRNFQQPTRGGVIYRKFNRVGFYENINSRSIKRFLDLFMETQMFDGFIHARESSRPHLQDLFETRIQEHMVLMEDSKINVLKSRMKRLVQNIGPILKK